MSPESTTIPQTQLILIAFVTLIIVTYFASELICQCIGKACEGMRQCIGRACEDMCQCIGKACEGMCQCIGKACEDMCQCIGKACEGMCSLVAVVPGCIEYIVKEVVFLCQSGKRALKRFGKSNGCVDETPVFVLLSSDGELLQTPPTTSYSSIVPDEEAKIEGEFRSDRDVGIGCMPKTCFASSRRQVPQSKPPTTLKKIEIPNVDVGVEPSRIEDACIACL